MIKINQHQKQNNKLDNRQKFISDLKIMNLQNKVNFGIQFVFGITRHFSKNGEERSRIIIPLRNLLLAVYRCDKARTSKPMKQTAFKKI